MKQPSQNILFPSGLDIQKANGGHQSGI